MEWTFKETSGFTRWLVDRLEDVDYQRLQRIILVNPTIGDVVQGCGGIRKLRFGDKRRGRGARGFFRMIYLVVPRIRTVFMIDGYAKNESDDLSAEEKRELKSLAAALSNEDQAGDRKS